MDKKKRETKTKLIRKKEKRTPKRQDLKLKITSPVTIRKDKEIAIDFASRVHKKFDKLVKATVLFGSQAKNQATSKSDIDIIIIVDDAAVQWDLELVAWYREELAKLIALSQYSRDLHVNTVKLTTWWNDLLHGDAVVINILRYGEALIDSGGFFNPLKSLLLQGKIHSTPEAVYVALQRAPVHLGRSKLSQMNAVEGIYWSMVDSAQAALITLGKLPPSPEHVPEMLKTFFVDKKLLKIDYVKWYSYIFDLHKSLTHGETRYVKGIEIDEWQDKAEKFLKKMSEIIDIMLETRKRE